MKEEFADRAVQGEESASLDYLEVRVVFHVNVTGFYNLTARLTYEQVVISAASNTSYRTPGRCAVLLVFGNRDIYNSRRSGHYTVQLMLRTPGFPAVAPIEETYNTSVAYYWDMFNPNYKKPWPVGSEFEFADGPVLTVQNSYITFTFDKAAASMSYYYTRDLIGDRGGRNGRFTVTFVRVLGYQDVEGFMFQRGEATHEAPLANATWRVERLENGTHPAFGPYMKFNITYTVPMRDLRAGAVAAALNVTFSFYFTGNPHHTTTPLISIPGATYGELILRLELSRAIGGTGLVVEQVLEDSTRNHDFLLRDYFGINRYTAGDVGARELKFNPWDSETIAKMEFVNRWNGQTYASYTWATAVEGGAEAPDQRWTTDVSYIPEGGHLRLYLAYRARAGEFLVFRSGLAFGLSGSTPPPPRPPPQPGEYHDPILYVLGSGLALAIIFLTMRLRTRAYVEEESEIARIEELELAGELEEGGPPLSIEERIEGEEEEWRRRREREGGEAGDAPPDARGGGRATAGAGGAGPRPAPGRGRPR
ncbi:MAG: hypothetical protein ACUVV6_05645, partial [Thermoplasmatota archaeon]